MVGGRDDFPPVRSLAVGAKRFTPFQHSYVEVVAIDEAPKIQSWLGLCGCQGKFHFYVPHKVYESEQLGAEFFKAAHTLWNLTLSEGEG